MIHQTPQFKICHTKLSRKSFWNELEIKNECHEHLVIESFLENSFEAPWGQKWIFWAFQNSIFLVFCKFFIDEFQTIIRENEARHQKLFKSKFGHRNLPREWFWSFFQLKNEYCGRFKIALFRFFGFCKVLIHEGGTAVSVKN